MRWYAALPLLLLTGCSIGAPPTVTPTPRPTSGATAGASGTPQLTGTTRTVLARLGLNIHAAPSTTAHVEGVASQGTQLTVLSYQASGGGWFKVQGQTVTGWIVANPAYTAEGQFQSYSSDTRSFAVLYPASWTFAEEVTDVVFRPQQQSAPTIVVRNAATLSGFGAEETPGYVSTFSNPEVVCGYTGTLVEYSRTGSAATPGTGSATPTLTHYATIRLKFDGTHALQMQFNYDDPSDLTLFTDFYDSIAFPYPLCEAPAASPSPTPR